MSVYRTIGPLVFTTSYWLIMKKRKREIIQSWIWSIFPKNNQVIYTLDTICGLNIMTLAEAVHEVFVHKLPFRFNEKNGKGRQFSHGFREF